MIGDFVSLDESRNYDWNTTTIEVIILIVVGDVFHYNNYFTDITEVQLQLNLFFFNRRWK